MFFFLNHFQHIILLKDLSTEIDVEILRKEFDNVDYIENAGNLITKNKYLLDRTDKLKKIKSTLQVEASNFLINAHNLKDKFKELLITTSWGNVSRKNEFHHEHTHPYSVVSGVFFIDNCISNYNFTLNIQPPEIPYHNHLTKCKCAIPALLATNYIPLEKIKNNLQGYAVFFLSNVMHSVQPIERDDVRRTLSFNTFFKGKTGEEEDELNSIVY
jgi:hypothetical protein